ncbi:hypothetical protein HPB52_024892 [Rhipicephalus sanguineus]|uniref:Uncharacterized protein n=1 Tax=Rhipicephalus sanguineus TaxID=34632 RepID=A0A9D4SN16_RHISA|nr:hypothetical protein HPB52_024892 [Rhipicephalus sanguineus]
MSGTHTSTATASPAPQPTSPQSVVDTGSASTESDLTVRSGTDLSSSESTGDSMTETQVGERGTRGPPERRAIRQRRNRGPTARHHWHPVKTSAEEEGIAPYLAQAAANDCLFLEPSAPDITAAPIHSASAPALTTAMLYDHRHLEIKGIPQLPDESLVEVVSENR